MNRQDFHINYWEYYLMLERKVIDTLNYVELCEDNFSTYSNQFASLIQSIGSELDEFFKIYNRKEASVSGHGSDLARCHSLRDT